MASTKQILREKRHARIRAKVKGTSARPRLIVFRSSSAIYAQLIDDEKRKTITCVSDLKIKNKEKKVERAKKVGLLIAEKAKELKIDSVVFDRAGYKYHGRVKALAEGAREGGLKF
mgnify:CR=1 FL=1